MTQPITLRQWLSDGPFTLTLSAGFFGFFAHAGFLRTLEENGLAPSGLSGSSAGALVGGLWASGRSAAELEDRLMGLRRTDFWDPGPGAGLLRGGLFRELLHEYLGTRHFESCRADLAISVFDVKRRTTRVLTTGELAPAIQASCTFPGLFHPVTIDGRPHIDGGVGDRAGLRGVQRGGRVLYHHLSTRSRWKKRFKKLSWFPRRDGMLPVIVSELPSVGPFTLPQGKIAYDTARRALKRALDRPMPALDGAPWHLD